MQKRKTMESDLNAEGTIRSFTLRIDESVLQQVDDAVSKHLVINSRNTWIANAIVEQLKREKKKQ